MILKNKVGRMTSTRFSSAGRFVVVVTVNSWWAFRACLGPVAFGLVGDGPSDRAVQQL